MTRRPFVRLVARLSLLLATVSYLTVAAVGPLAHLAYLQTSRTAIADAPGSPGKFPPAPAHDESHCLICHSLESLATPARATSLPLAPLRFDPRPPEIAALLREGVRPLAQARGPPLLA